MTPPAERLLSRLLFPRRKGSIPLFGWEHRVRDRQAAPGFLFPFRRRCSGLSRSTPTGSPLRAFVVGARGRFPSRAPESWISAPFFFFQRSKAGPPPERVPSTQRRERPFRYIVWRRPFGFFFPSPLKLEEKKAQGPLGALPL